MNTSSRHLLSPLRTIAGGCLFLTGLLATVDSAFATATSVPQPVTTHPRLWVTQADLPKLRTWAKSSNPVYQQGMVPTLSKAVADYNKCFPGGVQASPYPDPGDNNGYYGVKSEQIAWVLAFQSLIDPVPANRSKYAQYARNVIMVEMNEAAKGPAAGQPFRDPLFALFNRANFTSAALPLVVDWIYDAKDAQNMPILTAQDKATIRKVFLIWSQQCLNAYISGGDHPDPIGVTNSPALLPGNNDYRIAANNYYSGHAQLLTLMALAMDPSDDPPLNPNRTPATLGNTLRSYIPNATGAWLYQQYALFGEPAAIRSGYKLPLTADVGSANGGMPPEGFLYGHSFSSIIGEMLALKTSGFATTALSGPQAALADGHALIWDRFSQALIVSLVPAPQTPQPFATFTNPLIQIADPAGQSYLGSIYQFASYGDILRMYMTPDFASAYGLLALLDQKSGVTSRQTAEKWFIVNAVEGGKASFYSRLGNPYSWGVQDTLIAFLLLDPAEAPYNYADPRPGYPAAFYDEGQARLVEHAGLTSSSSMFDYHCSWNSIQHQQLDAGSFELYRKGEWLTKGLANYDNYYKGQGTDYHNTMSLQNWCPVNVSALYPTGIPTFFLKAVSKPLWPMGSQFPGDLGNGDPTTVQNVTPTYTYLSSDITNLYNFPNFYTPTDAGMDILHASRSVIWLKPDYIVVYDRATSLHNGFKRVNFTTVGQPVVAGNLTTTTTPGGQHLYLKTLLPNAATTTITPHDLSTEGLTQIASMETATDRVTIEDTAKPLDARFLHVLQGADGATAASATSLIQSTSGTPFDGAVVTALKTIVLFQRDITTPFTSTVFTLPSGITTWYVGGLTPFAGYSVVQSGLKVTITAGGPIAADKAGVLTGPPSTATVLTTITSQPVSQTVGAASTVSFNVLAVSSSPLTYSWQRLPKGSTAWANLTDDTTYQGSKTATLSVVKVSAGMGGDRFRVLVTGGKKSVWSASATLSVLAAAPVTPVIVGQPVNQVVVVGSKVVYSIQAQGRGTMVYQWEQSKDHGKTWTKLQYNGAYWNGGATPLLTLTGITQSQNGWQFRCTASNGAKPDAVSRVVTLVVVPSL